jgi:hypothetical protein
MTEYENLNNLIQEEKERFVMMKGQLEQSQQKDLILTKCKYIAIVSRSKFLEKFLLNSFEESFNKSSDPPTLDASLSFGYNGILAMAICEQQYTQELENALITSLYESRKKDEEILNLEEKISEAKESPPETLIELQLENSNLREIVSVFAGKIQKMKEEIKKYKKIIISLEKDHDKLKEILQLQKNICKNVEKRLENLKEEAEKKNIQLKSYKKKAQENEKDFIVKQSTLETSNTVEKLLEIIQGLREEKEKNLEEHCKEKHLFEEKIEELNESLYKEKKNIERLVKRVKEYQAEILELEDEKEKMSKEHYLALQRFQNENKEIITNLRNQNRNLQRKIQELASKDLSNGSGEYRPSLRDELVQDEESDQSFISTFEFQDVIQNRFISEECVVDLKEKIKILDLEVLTLRQEISEKDQLITMMKKDKGLEGSAKSRPSFLMKIKPNPLVLKLFGRN